VILVLPDVHCAAQSASQSLKVRQVYSG